MSKILLYTIITLFYVEKISGVGFTSTGFTTFTQKLLINLQIIPKEWQVKHLYFDFENFFFFCACAIDYYIKCITPNAIFVCFYKLKDFIFCGDCMLQIPYIKTALQCNIRPQHFLMHLKRERSILIHSIA